MIIGGHGNVGQYITRELKDYDLILVGRNKDKIKKFLDQENIQAEICVMDVHHMDYSKLEQVSCVIACIDQENTKLVHYCDKHSIDYMDVTANSDYINKIMQLKLSNTSRILLGVGLAPGLTNLLAETLIHTHPEIKKVDIQVILGLGERHGDAAIQWTLDNFIKNYRHRTLKDMKPFMRKSKLNASEKKLVTYNFNFVDQHMLNQKYENKSFTTYLGFDQSIITSFLHGAKKLGLLNSLKNKRVYHIAENFLKNPKFGTNIFIASAQSGEHALTVSGQDEGKFTGLIAAEVAKRFVTSNLQKGLLGISDVIGLKEVVHNEAFGLRFTRK